MNFGTIINFTSNLSKRTYTNMPLIFSKTTILSFWYTPIIWDMSNWKARHYLLGTEELSSTEKPRQRASRCAIDIEIFPFLRFFNINIFTTCKEGLVPVR